MVDYPDMKMKELKGSDGTSTNVIDSNVEGRPVEAQTIRSGVKSNKKSAGNVGSSNVSHS